MYTISASVKVPNSYAVQVSPRFIGISITEGTMQ